MKIEPKSGPSIPASPNTSLAKAAERREAAIKILQGQRPASSGNAQSEAVSNPSHVSPEEMSAISPTSSAKLEYKPTHGNTNEGDPSAESRASEKPEVPLSERHALLARREKQIRQQAQALKAREAAIKAAEDAARAASAPKAPSFDESKYVPRDRLTTDPFTVLINELGLSYEQLTELALNAPKPEQLAMQSEMKALREELKAVKAAAETTKKDIEDQRSSSRIQAEKEIKYQVSSLVQNDPEFETIKATRSINDVVDLITKTYDEDGILMTVEEAARQVEEYLTEEATRLSRLNKIQQRLKATSSQSKPHSQDPKAPAQMKTLTNSVTSSRPLTAKERALLAFEGKLGK